MPHYIDASAVVMIALVCLVFGVLMGAAGLELGEFLSRRAGRVR